MTCSPSPGSDLHVRQMNLERTDHGQPKGEDKGRTPQIRTKIEIHGPLCASIFANNQMYTQEAQTCLCTFMGGEGICSKR